MVHRKLKARGDLFRQAFSSAKIAFLRSMRELERLVQELQLISKSVTTLGVESLALPDGRWVQVFAGQAGLVLFYSDGSTYYALPACN